MVSRSITIPKPNLPPKPTEKPILPPKPTQSSITHSRCISEGGEGVLPPRLPLKSRPLEKPFTDPLIDSMHSQPLAAIFRLRAHLYQGVYSVHGRIRKRSGPEKSFLDDEGWYAWFGTSEGQLNVLDIAEGKTIDRRSSLHHQAVTHLLHGRMLASMSFDWRPQMSKVSFTKGDLATVIGEELWMASNRTIVAVRALAATGSQSAVQDIDFSDGLITCMAASEGLGWVIVGHQDGKVTVWNSLERRRLGGVLLAPYRINSLLVVLDRYLWVAVTNKLLVYDLLPPRRGTGPTLWVLRKEIRCARCPHHSLAADPVGFLITSKYTIASACENGQVKFWDGLLAGDWQVRVRVCSWNIDASKPSDLLSSAINSKFLEPWLCPDPQEVPDLIVVGFQEIVDLESKKVTAKSIFRKKEDTGEHITQRYNRWQQRLVQAMSVAAPGCRYKLIECQNLVGLFSCIFIKESESSRVQGIEVSTTKTGFGGLHGNKGAIAVRFLWDDTSLCFVNCHLAAGQTQVSARNNDVSTILKKTILSPMNSSAAPLVPEALSRDQKNHLTAWETAPLFVGGGDGQQILDHEVCVFSGDLNYRIDLPRDKVEDLIRHKEWDQLQEYDQLFQLRRSKVPFMLRLFTEPRLCFAPTYKYDPYTTKYDTTDKRRCPAWCDRILYRGTSLKVMDYGRAECNVSDHRPIAASFTCLIKTVVLDKYQLACQEAAETWATRCRSHCMRNLNNHLVRLGYSPALIATAMELEGSDPIRVAHHLFKRVQDTVSLTYTPF
ncbi:hypothetical protein L0F63_001075 [Massospora cicadina]|nr:hypothetical protein L0F63_001075 [Massospora cicadina]